NTDSLCWEANVITFNNSSVLGSKNQVNITTTFSNGWVDLLFPFIASGSRHQLVGGATNTVAITTTTGAVQTGTLPRPTYAGLPVVGFAAQTFNNGTLPIGPTTNVQSAYGGNFIHKYTRSIQ